VAACTTWNDCVSFARNKFEKYFTNKAKQLLSSFPVDPKDGSKPFWTFPKRAPTPLMFNLSNDLHLGFVATLASAAAALLGLEEGDSKPEALRTLLGSVKVSPFLPKNKTIVTDESVTRQEATQKDSTDEVDLKDLALKIKEAKTKVSSLVEAISFFYSNHSLILAAPLS